jgi:hypothetical protein
MLVIYVLLLFVGRAQIRRESYQPEASAPESGLQPTQLKKRLISHRDASTIVSQSPVSPPVSQSTEIDTGFRFPFLITQNF